jgi:hypothetical protein
VITESRVLLEAQEVGNELLNSVLCLLLCLWEIFWWELGCDYLSKENDIVDEI